MISQILEEIKTINIDKGDDPLNIKIDSMVVLDDQVYKCIDDLGDNYSFVLEDEDVNQYIYDAMAGTIKPY